MFSELPQLLAVPLADAAATAAFGRRLGQHLAAGDVVALCGELGSGKTTLVRALAEGLPVDDPDAVASPTYLLVVEHPGPLPLVHADAYLPQKLRHFLDEGGLDYLLDRRAVVAIEWADRIEDLLPPGTLWIELAMAPGGGRVAICRCGEKQRFPWLSAAAIMDQGE